MPHIPASGVPCDACYILWLNMIAFYSGEATLGSALLALFKSDKSMNK